MMQSRILYLFMAGLLLCGCSHKPAKDERPQDLQAKKMLQGVWIDEDEEDVVFRAKGDTIYYSDESVQPVYFKIVEDTLYLEGSHEMKYPIVKQAPHIFQFKNQDGDIIKLVKSSDPEDRRVFQHQKTVALNQNQLIKRDTVVMVGGERYHSYVQINPTTYKVLKPTVNDDGVEVDNIYYDNIIHISLFHGAQQVYSHDFYKRDFASLVDEDNLKQCILSDMVIKGVDSKGITYQAVLQVPDNQTSYLVNTFISFNGRLRMSL
ncbi:MAG: DUF4738 domain-containing protein [Prevotellaceae bacterium]|nr:DUF4738 domain-containing protein [Prevotellaceae bacterium]